MRDCSKRYAAVGWIGTSGRLGGTGNGKRFVLVKYILRRSLVALASGGTWVTIPAGATVEVPAMIVGAGTIKVRYKGQLMTVVAKEFFDSARIVLSE